MSLSELRAFNALAEAGSFGGAAQRLGRTQPTVTAQIKALETGYGVELFVRGRGTRTVITPIGERLFETTRQLFQLELDATTLLQGASSMATGVLRLGAVAPRRALSLVERFAREFPHIDIQLELGNSSELQERVVRCSLDVAVLGAHEDHPACSAVVLSRPEIVLIARRDSPAFRCGGVTREMFAELVYIQREKGSESRALMDAMLQRHAFRPRRTIEIASREGVAAAAAAGLGVAFISSEELPETSELSVTRFADFRVFGEMRLIYLRSRARTALILAFLSLVGRSPGDDPATEQTLAG